MTSPLENPQKKKHCSSKVQLVRYHAIAWVFENWTASKLHTIKLLQWMTTQVSLHFYYYLSNKLDFTCRLGKCVFFCLGTLPTYVLLSQSHTFLTASWCQQYNDDVNVVVLPIFATSSSTKSKFHPWTISLKFKYDRALAILKTKNHAYFCRLVCFSTPADQGLGVQSPGSEFWVKPKVGFLFMMRLYLIKKSLYYKLFNKANISANLAHNASSQMRLSSLKALKMQRCKSASVDRISYARRRPTSWFDSGLDFSRRLDLRDGGQAIGCGYFFHSFAELLYETQSLFLSQRRKQDSFLAFHTHLFCLLNVQPIESGNNLNKWPTTWCAHFFVLATL